MERTAQIFIAVLSLLSASGCQLVAHFDHEKIPNDWAAMDGADGSTPKGDGAVVRARNTTGSAGKAGTVAQAAGGSAGKFARAGNGGAGRAGNGSAGRTGHGGADDASGGNAGAGKGGANEASGGKTDHIGGGEGGAGGAGAGGAGGSLDAGVTDAAQEGGADAEITCAQDTECGAERYCNQEAQNKTCVIRLSNIINAACNRNRQCAAGGGCCRGVCIALSQNNHCGVSAGDDQQTCGDDCTDNDTGHACQANACGCDQDGDCPSNRFCNISFQCEMKFGDGKPCEQDRQCLSNRCRAPGGPGGNGKPRQCTDDNSGGNQQF